MEARSRGDLGEIEGRYRGGTSRRSSTWRRDLGEIEGRYRGGIGEIEGRNEQGKQHMEARPLPSSQHPNPSYPSPKPNP